jgi:hypothetical protein
LGTFEGKAAVEGLLDLDDLVLVVAGTGSILRHGREGVESDSHGRASVGNSAHLLSGFDVIFLRRWVEAELLLLIEVEHSFRLRNGGKLVDSGCGAVGLRSASFRILGGGPDSWKPLSFGEEGQLLGG